MEKRHPNLIWYNANSNNCANERNAGGLVGIAQFCRSHADMSRGSKDSKQKIHLGQGTIYLTSLSKLCLPEKKSNSIPACDTWMKIIMKTNWKEWNRYPNCVTVQYSLLPQVNTRTIASLKSFTVGAFLPAFLHSHLLSTTAFVRKF